MAYATSGQETLTGHRAQPEFAKKVTLRLVQSGSENRPLTHFGHLGF